jgi:SAM-dependent methyltransferase
MATERKPQLAYSELMDKMLVEDVRRQKAHKLIAVITHFLGRDDLDGLRAIDVGCSAGFIADELSQAGARTLGVDIDVPGVQKASARFGDRTDFLCADGSRLPLPDRSIDVAVLNHIYEHVVDPDAVMADLHRVLADDGVLYLGVANRLGVVEPHYRLPFLSYLGQDSADRYMRATGKGEHYYEQLKTRPALRRMARHFAVWEYTLPVILDPARFHSGDAVHPLIRHVPEAALRGALPLIPTYLWIATKSDATPQGPPLRGGPTRL